MKQKRTTKAAGKPSESRTNEHAEWKMAAKIFTTKDVRAWVTHARRLREEIKSIRACKGEGVPTAETLALAELIDLLWPVLFFNAGLDLWKSAKGNEIWDEAKRKANNGR